MALKEEEAAVYDRQLRVWGVETQRKLTAARVLLVGFGKLAAEIAKNITLAGVGHVTLLDDSPAAELLGSNFLNTEGTAEGQTAAEAAAKSLQAMNPLVKVTSAAGSTADFCNTTAAAAAGGEGGGSGVLGEQDLVIATGLTLQQVCQLDASCRSAGVKFMAAAAAGPAGWFFLDLQQHTYTPKESKCGPISVPYNSFESALTVPPAQLTLSTHPMYHVLQACLQTEQQLQRPLTAADLQATQQHLTTSCSNNTPHQAAAQQLLAAWLQNPAEFAPVCAVLGGVIANNVVAAVSAASAPLNNLLYYSLFDSRAIVEQQPAAPAAGGSGAAAAGGKAGVVQQQEEALEID